MITWLSIAGMTLITFINRYLFFIEKIRFVPGEKLTRFLSFSSFAVLTSIWAPILFHFDIIETSNATQFHFSYAGLDYLIAGLLAALLAFMHVKSIVVVLLSTGLFFCLRFMVFS